MSRPTVNDVQAVDPILQNLLVSYMQSDTRFVADRVFPPVPVNTDSGTYYIFDKAYWLTDEAEVRAPGADYATSDFAVSTSTYATVQYALAKRIADEERANSLMPMDLETAAVQWLALKGMIRKERLFAAAAMASGIWETSASVSNKWSDYANSDPVADVNTGRRTISQSTGKDANVFVMGEIVRDRLTNHPDLLDRIKYTQAATGSSVESALASLFMVDRLYVGRAIYNTANKAQTASLSPVIDDDALLCHVNPSANLMMPSAGYNITWAGGGGAGSILPVVRLQENDADLIKYKQQLVYKVVATDLGYFFADVTD